MLRIIAAAVTLFVGLGAHQAHGQWYENGESASDTSWRKNHGELGAVLLLSSDPDEFLAQWDQPATPGYAPKMETTGTVRRGDLIVGFLFFGGCQADDEGLCNLVADLLVLDPDGGEYGRVDGAELWVGKPPPPEGNTQLGKTYLGIVIEPEDPLGEYTFTAHVCDRVAETCLDLTQVFEATGRLVEFDLYELLHGYYLDPRPDHIDRAIRELATSGILEDENAFPPMVAFLTEVFSANRGELEGWKETIAVQDEAAREVLLFAVALSDNPKGILTWEQQAPYWNDMLWGAYFASGDTEYLQQIIENTQLAQERRDLNRYLTGASAKWSLSSNLRNHLRVKQYVEASLAQSSKHAEVLQEVLDKEPGTIRAATTEILRTQHEAGIW